MLILHDQLIQQSFVMPFQSLRDQDILLPRLRRK